MSKTIKDEQGNVYKIKKPFYKKWYFILFVLLILFTIGGSIGGKKSDAKKSDKQEQTKKNNPVKVDGNKKEVVEKKDDTPIEYKNALKKANSYSKIMSMSKVGIHDQLISEHGEKFSPEAAQYAIDNLNADFNANALKKAKS